LRTWIGTIMQSAGILLCLSSCAMFGRHDEKVKPIANPFYAYRGGVNGDPSQNIILRTKKGDRSVELELPGDAQSLSDFVLPVSPAFRDTGRSPASEEASIDETYKDRAPGYSDREITQTFPQGLAEDEGKRREIEKGLNLTPSDDSNPTEGSPSYLAATDRIKQLYKSGRFEAALLEIDEIIRQFQTDGRLYEMRGTLLDRLGRRELALKSWKQALRFEPKNQSLRRFIERKELSSTAGLQ